MAGIEKRQSLFDKDNFVCSYLTIVLILLHFSSLVPDVS